MHAANCRATTQKKLTQANHALYSSTFISNGMYKFVKFTIFLCCGITYYMHVRARLYICTKYVQSNIRYTRVHLSS